VNNVISQIINESQTGFIKGRYIGENVRLIFELIEYVNVNNKHGLLLFSDFESFHIKNGVRQGCPLSSFLFLISIKLLSNYIEKGNTIKGIHFN